MLTGNGTRLLSKIQVGGSLEITRVCAGNGMIPNFQYMTKYDYMKYVEQMEDLIEYTCNIKIISNIIRDNGTTIMTTLLTNKDLKEAIFLHEVGIFAKDAQGNEVLYAYSYSDLPVYLPIFSGDEEARIEWTLITTIGNAAKVIIKIEKVEINLNDFNNYLASIQDSWRTQIMAINANFDMINDKIKNFESTQVNLQNQINGLFGTITGIDGGKF